MIITDHLLVYRFDHFHWNEGAHVGPTTWLTAIDAIASFTMTANTGIIQVLDLHVGLPSLEEYTSGDVHH